MGGEMKTREEAAKFAEKLMKDGVPDKENIRAWHFGRLEIRALFDFIYDGPPTSAKEEVFEPLRLRNSNVEKWRET